MSGHSKYILVLWLSRSTHGTFSFVLIVPSTINTRGIADRNVKFRICKSYREVRIIESISSRHKAD